MAKPATTSDEGDGEELNREAELEGGRMPFFSHLAELRDRVRNAAICFVAAFLVCWYFSDDIFAWLRQPIHDIWVQHTGPALAAVNAKLAAQGESPAMDWGPFQLHYFGLTQPFWVNMSVALWAGIFVASPFIFYQLWRFIAPGLYKRERKITISFAILSAVFFVSGALFCFELALPRLYNFFLGYNSLDLRSVLGMQEYLDITRDSMLAFGAIFELPLLIYFLAMIGMVTHRSLWKFNRWFVVLAFIIGAVLTPGPDVPSQFTMALPMIALYNISILFAWRVTVKRERAEAAQRAKDDASPKKTRRIDDEDDDDTSD